MPERQRHAAGARIVGVAVLEILAVEAADGRDSLRARAEGPFENTSVGPCCHRNPGGIRLISQSILFRATLHELLRNRALDYRPQRACMPRLGLQKILPRVTGTARL